MCYAVASDATLRTHPAHRGGCLACPQCRQAVSKQVDRGASGYRDPRRSSLKERGRSTPLGRGVCDRSVLVPGSV